MTNPTVEVGIAEILKDIQTKQDRMYSDILSRQDKMYANMQSRQDKILEEIKEIKINDLLLLE